MNRFCWGGALWALAAVAAVASLASTGAYAQAPDPEADEVHQETQTDEAQTSNNTERAATAFDQAEVAWSERRLADAARLLADSLRLSPAAPTAFNLARVLAEMGRPTESARHLNALLDGEYGPLAEAQAVDVRERLASTSATFGRIVIRADGPGMARVRVDGVSAGHLSADEVIREEVDPGRHRIVARLAHMDLEQSVDVGRGEEANVLFDLPSTPTPSGEENRSVFASPVLWIVVGVLVAGAAVGAVLLTQRAPDQVIDPVFGNVAALR